MSDEIVWVKIEPGSFKVWGCNLSQYPTGAGSFLSFFGNLGKSIRELRKINKEYDDYRDAVDNYFQKSKEKRAKGYVPIERSVYDECVEDNDVFRLIDEVKKVYRKWKKI